MTDSRPARRVYDSPVRRARASATRERIVTAAAELLHGFPIWNWRAVTVAAVAARAGVNQRTVYRHFATEKDLRDAVLARLGDEADVQLEGLTLDQFDDVATRVLRYISHFPFEPRATADATGAAAKPPQRAALQAAVDGGTAGWPATDRRIAAAMFDVLWNVVSYEQLVGEWDLAPDDAIAGVAWVIRLVREAIEQDRRPEPR
jgi:AcrR family transcriptional regulator